MGATVVSAVGLVMVAFLYYRKTVNPVLLFWAAFILTRPLGAAVGDFLDQPLDHGGLVFSRPPASLVLAGAIGLLILLLPQSAGRHA